MERDWDPLVKCLALAFAKVNIAIQTCRPPRLWRWPERSMGVIDMKDDSKEENIGSWPSKLGMMQQGVSTKMVSLSVQSPAGDLKLEVRCTSLWSSWGRRWGRN